MKRVLITSVALTTIAITCVLFQMTGCTKDTMQPPPKVCEIRGTYSGSNLSSTGASSTISYTFEDNNFAIGSLTPKGEGVTFGGYRNTCDSIFLSVFFTHNSSYYLLEGKFSNNKATISGTFKNLTNTSDFGTFTISK